MTFCTVFLYLDSLLSSLGRVMSHGQFDANVAHNALTSENTVTYVGPVVLTWPHRQPQASLASICARVPLYGEQECMTRMFPNCNKP